jgi:hypothetical protein
LTRIVNFEGRKFVVPDDATDDEVAQILSAPRSEETVTNYGPDKVVVRKPVPPDQEGGYLAAAGAGLRSLVEGTVGMPGDLGNLATVGSGYLAKSLGYDSKAIDREVASRLADNPLPTSASLHEATTPYLGEGYQPRSFGEKALSTGMQFLPAALTGGGNLVTRALTNVVAPAVATETAGALTHDNPYARVAAALISPTVASRALTPFPVSAERQALTKTLEQEGVGVTAGQTTGNKMLRALETQTGGGAARQTMEQQGEQFTRAALRRAGIDAPRATPEVMDHAFTRIRNEFDNLAGSTTVPFDQTLQNRLLTDVLHYQQMRGGSAIAPFVEGTMNDMAAAAAKNGGVLPGEAFRIARTRLTDAVRTGPDDLKGVARDMLETLDDAAGRHLPQDMVDRWQTARRQYRNILVLEQAATGAGENAAAGLISPSALRNATVQKHGRRNYAIGQGDFADLARAGEGVMKPLPDSGTAINTRAGNWGTGALSIFGGGAGAMHSPEAAIIGMLLGSVAPAAAGRALMSGPVQSYLANQVAPGKMDKMTRAITSALLARPSIVGP